MKTLSLWHWIHSQIRKLVGAHNRPFFFFWSGYTVEDKTYVKHQIHKLVSSDSGMLYFPSGCLKPNHHSSLVELYQRRPPHLLIPSLLSLNSFYIYVHILLKPSLKDFEHYLASVWNEYGSFEHSLALPFFGTGMKSDHSSPLATAKSSKFAGI